MFSWSCGPKNLSTARSIPASIKPKEFPAVATQSKLGISSNLPSTTSISGDERVAQRISSAAVLFGVTMMKRSSFIWLMFLSFPSEQLHLRLFEEIVVLEDAEVLEQVGLLVIAVRLGLRDEVGEHR